MTREPTTVLGLPSWAAVGIGTWLVWSAVLDVTEKAERQAKIIAELSARLAQIASDMEETP